ncbi:hypothetical protein COCNU_07G015790 [Cocos nucifera]|uniref:Pectin acetylesterase n=1 Tax=Cocos nucifera TaxID=13894 RepID=A0A8K0IH00_COCNU|nr:hypothetical protein COCNU_07G015790 [Cocos nucifera]
MEDLLAMGMSKAKNALLSGCSAGGLTSMLHCDNFRALLPLGTRVKCLSDGGYFINVKDIAGAEHIKAFFNDVVTTHGSAQNLPSSSTSRLTPSMCFFPQNMVQQIRTPLFILNAAYDSWQIRNILVPGVADPHGTWHNCKLAIQQCSSPQLQIMQGFRTEFLNALAGFGSSSSTGMFINSCYAHCQSEMQETWLSSDSPVLEKTENGGAGSPTDVFIKGMYGTFLSKHQSSSLLQCIIVAMESADFTVVFLAPNLFKIQARNFVNFLRKYCFQNFELTKHHNFMFYFPDQVKSAEVP